MRRLVDFSYWQTRNGVDCAAVAASVDAAYVRWCDYSIYADTDEPDHSDCLSKFHALGLPAGSYLYPDPRVSARDQVKRWRDSCPETIMPPMLDLENSHGVMGGQLSEWRDTALDQMTGLWTPKPVHYTSLAYVNGHGLAAPNVDCHIMLAEYHRGYIPYGWQQRDTWETTAYSTFGGPDPVWGMAKNQNAIWQFTSSAECPGLVGLVDMSLMTDAFYNEITQNVQPISKDELSMADINDIMNRFNDIQNILAVNDKNNFDRFVADEERFGRIVRDALANIKVDGISSDEIAKAVVEKLKGLSLQ